MAFLLEAMTFQTYLHSKNLTNLTHLDLEFNYKISDVSPLKDLTNLVFLNLELNLISDVSPLEGLTNLVNLDFDDNQVQDVSPLKNMIYLTRLDAFRQSNIGCIATEKYDKSDRTRS